MPTFSWPQERLLLLIAGGRDALVQSVEGAEDESEEAIRLVQRHEVETCDVLIAVAASGTTPFTLACLREANQRGALTIAIANNRDTPLLAEAAHPIWLDMIRLGRVYRGLMVDLKAVNKKLLRRKLHEFYQIALPTPDTRVRKSTRPPRKP